MQEKKAPSSFSMKLNVISGQSIISVAEHQVIRNLIEPSELTMMHLDTYADYLRPAEPRTQLRALVALLTTVGTRIMKFHGRYVEIYGPYQVIQNVDGISIYTKTYATTDNDQIGQIFLDREELKVRRIGHDAMIHIGYEADVNAHLPDNDRNETGVTGAVRYRSSSQFNADKEMGKDGFHQRGPATHELKVSSRQSWSHLRSRQRSNNISRNGRRKPLDKFTRGGEPG